MISVQGRWLWSDKFTSWGGTDGTSLEVCDLISLRSDAWCGVRPFCSQCNALCTYWESIRMFTYHERNSWTVPAQRIFNWKRFSVKIDPSSKNPSTAPKACTHVGDRKRLRDEAGTGIWRTWVKCKCHCMNAFPRFMQGQGFRQKAYDADKQMPSRLTSNANTTTDVL